MDVLATRRRIAKALERIADALERRERRKGREAYRDAVADTMRRSEGREDAAPPDGIGGAQ